jgi:hypothetical protein
VEKISQVAPQTITALGVRRALGAAGRNSALPEPVDGGLGPVFPVRLRAIDLIAVRLGGGRFVLAVAPCATAALAVPALPAGFADHAPILTCESTHGDATGMIHP